MSKRLSFQRVALTVGAIMLLASACTTTSSVEPAPERFSFASADTEVPNEWADSELSTPAEPPTTRTEESPGGDQAPDLTTEFLAQAATRTIEASSLRFEGYLEETGLGLVFGSRTDPFLSGAVSGDLARSVADRTNFISERVQAQARSDAEFVTTVITDGPDAYVTTPQFELLTDVLGLSSSDAAWASEVAAGWGYVDLDVVPFGELVGAIDIGSGPRGTNLLRVIDKGRTVVDGGASEVRGIATHVFYTDITFRDVIERSGGSGRNLAGVDDETITVEVHVDDEGFVRRIQYVSDLSRLGGLGDTWRRIDYFDFETDIELTAPVEWVDVTAPVQAFTE